MTHRILTVVGARPQFVKAAPVARALRNAGLQEILVHTGQHFDPMMSDVFFEELEIEPPHHRLDIHSLGHGAMTGRMLECIERVIGEEKPDLVLVYGDTNSTLAGALAAVKLHVPIAHVEAGLRSFNRRMPEEINRVVTDHVSALLLCPTANAVTNLAAEGITRGVFATGDVMFDASIEAAGRAEHRSRVLEHLDLQRKQYAVATIHRAENTDGEASFKKVVNFLQSNAGVDPLVLVAHPRTRMLIDRLGITLDRIRLAEPLGYLDMTWLVKNAAAVFTDSGGLQKEAYFFRVPCVTLRDETEWVETVEAGWNRLWNEPNTRSRTDISDYGTGQSATVIVQRIIEFLRGRTGR